MKNVYKIGHSCEKRECFKAFHDYFGAWYQRKWNKNRIENFIKKINSVIFMARGISRISRMFLCIFIKIIELDENANKWWLRNQYAMWRWFKFINRNLSTRQRTMVSVFLDLTHVMFTACAFRLSDSFVFHDRRSSVTEHMRRTAISCTVPVYVLTLKRSPLRLYIANCIKEGRSWSNISDIDQSSTLPWKFSLWKLKLPEAF